MEILITEKTEGYELLDSGIGENGGEKLERFGSVVLRRPDPQVLWKKKLGAEDWEKAHAVYTRSADSGKWSVKEGVSNEWQVKLEGITFNLKLLPSKHLGVFPEQIPNWKWLEEKISKSKKPIQVLNLFAYTGGASIACARAGAEVVHVDASKFPVDYAKRNLDDSGLGDKKVRFIVDDARKFVEREIKRGNKYDVVLLDPPVYGKSDNHVWNLSEDLPELLNRIKEVLSDKPLAIVLNGYASEYSAVTYGNLLKGITEKFSGEVIFGELGIVESGAGRTLKAGIFARFEGK
jgi:23S rRNA (cytosine1962-C5)-methyltransferase